MQITKVNRGKVDLGDELKIEICFSYDNDGITIKKNETNYVLSDSILRLHEKR
jgi:hypothetical protein